MVFCTVFPKNRENALAHPPLFAYTEYMGMFRHRRGAQPSKLLAGRKVCGRFDPYAFPPFFKALSSEGLFCFWKNAQSALLKTIPLFSRPDRMIFLSTSRDIRQAGDTKENVYCREKIQKKKKQKPIS